MKNEVLSAIYEALYAAEIEIPFPKRDVFVHFPDEKGAKNLPLSPEGKEPEAGETRDLRGNMVCLILYVNNIKYYWNRRTSLLCFYSQMLS